LLDGFHCRARPVTTSSSKAWSGFEPSEPSHRVALDVLAVLITLLAAAGVAGVADLVLIRSPKTGIAAEQIANDPNGRTFGDETTRAIRYLLDAISADPTKRTTRRSTRAGAPLGGTFHVRIRGPRFDAEPARPPGLTAVARTARRISPPQPEIWGGAGSNWPPTFGGMLTLSVTSDRDVAGACRGRP
jgi:hypothetical protein